MGFAVIDDVKYAMLTVNVEKCYLFVFLVQFRIVYNNLGLTLIYHTGTLGNCYNTVIIQDQL